MYECNKHEECTEINQKIINFIRSIGFYYRRLSAFSCELESEYYGFGFYTEVRFYTTPRFRNNHGN